MEFGSDDREARAARNQSAFRTLNERMRDMNADIAGITSEFVIVCECADTSCIEQLTMMPIEYTAVRGNPRHFAILGDHIYPDVETVVRKMNGYVVVEKTGEAAAVAEQLSAQD